MNAGTLIKGGLVVVVLTVLTVCYFFDDIVAYALLLSIIGIDWLKPLLGL